MVVELATSHLLTLQFLQWHQQSVSTLSCSQCPTPTTNSLKKTKTCHPNRDSLHLQLMHTWTLKLVVITLAQWTGMLICKCKLVHNSTKLNVLCWLGAHGIYHTIDLHMKRGQRGGGGGLCCPSGKDSPSHTFLHFCVFLLAHSSPFTLLL